MAKSLEKRLEELKAKQREGADLIRKLEKEKRESDREKARKHYERTKIQRARLHSQMGEKMGAVREHLSSYSFSCKGADGEMRKLTPWEDLCQHVPALAELIEKYDKLDENAPVSAPAAKSEPAVKEAKKESAPAEAAPAAKAEEKSSEKAAEPAKAEEKKPAEKTEDSVPAPSIGGIDLSSFMS